jgi:HlyD family secretion protein
LGLVLGAAVASAGIVGYRWLNPPPVPEPDDASGGSSVLAGDQVTALGRLEPAGGVVSVGAPPGYRLDSLAVKVGDDVEEGEEIGRLNGYLAADEEVAYVKIQLEDAQSRFAADEAYGQALVAEAEAAAALLESQKLEIEAAQARLPGLEQQASLAAEELARLELLDNRLVSEAERQRQRLASTQAQNALDAAHKSLKQLQSAHAANEQAVLRKRESAEANLARIRTSDPRRGLEQQLKLAETKRDAMVVRSPLDGVVLRIRTRPGELTGHRPVAEVGNTRQMYVVAEVDQSDVGRVKKGQAVEIRDGGLGMATLQGEVVQVDSVVAGNVERDLDPTAAVDRRVVEVRIRLRAEDSPLAAEYVGMQVDVTIKVPAQAAASE